MHLYSHLLEFQVPSSSGASSKHRDGSAWPSEKGTLPTYPQRMPVWSNTRRSYEFGACWQTSCGRERDVDKARRALTRQQMRRECVGSEAEYSISGEKADLIEIRRKDRRKKCLAVLVKNKTERIRGMCPPRNLNIKAPSGQEIIHTCCWRCDMDTREGEAGMQGEGTFMRKTQLSGLFHTDEEREENV